MTEYEFYDTDINSDICAEWVPFASSRNMTAYAHDKDYGVYKALLSPTTDAEQGSQIQSNACSMQSSVKQAAIIHAARYTFCINTYTGATTFTAYTYTYTYATTFTALMQTKSKTPRSAHEESDVALSTLVQRRSGDSVRVQNIRISSPHLRTLY